MLHHATPKTRRLCVSTGRRCVSQQFFSVSSTPDAYAPRAKVGYGVLYGDVGHCTSGLLAILRSSVSREPVALSTWDKLHC